MLVVKIPFRASQYYYETLIEAHAQACDIPLRLWRQNDTIVIVFEQDAPNLEPFLQSLEQILPASIFADKARRYQTDTPPIGLDERLVRLPVSLAVCPKCQQEMFDISSRRFYYPFTSCNACGVQSAFLERYPFERSNTLMRFFTPCEACQEELKHNPFRKAYPLISCGECGIALKMRDKKSERIANTKGEYLRLFEVAARAVASGKTVSVQTLHGKRLFGTLEAMEKQRGVCVMFCSAKAMDEHLNLTQKEFHTLLSIERPVVRVACKSDLFERRFSQSVKVKYPDEGMSILLCRQFLEAGIEYVCFRDAQEGEGDYAVEFDLALEPLGEGEVFVYQDRVRNIDATRLAYPACVYNPQGVMSVAGSLGAVPTGEATVIDLLQKHPTPRAVQVRIEEDTDLTTQGGDEQRFKVSHGAVMSVIAERGLISQKVSAVFFEAFPQFVFYDGKKVRDAFVSDRFDLQEVCTKIAKLREGSDRLVRNFQERFSNVCKALEEQSTKGEFWGATAVVLGLDGEGLEGVWRKSLQFMGKGGVQVDMRIRENRFDYEAFLASLMSYRLAGVPTELLCYSIFESFGDFITDVIEQMEQKFQTEAIACAGKCFANAALFSRIERNLGRKNLHFNSRFPMGKESGVYGALYL